MSQDLYFSAAEVLWKLDMKNASFRKLIFDNKILVSLILKIQVSYIFNQKV